MAMELYRGEWSDKEYLAESEIIYEEKNNLKKIYYIFDVNSICDSRQRHIYSLCTGGNLCQTAKYFCQHHIEENGMAENKRRLLFL